MYISPIIEPRLNCVRDNISIHFPSLRKSNGFLQPGWVQCSLFSYQGGWWAYPKHAPKSGFSAIRKECLGENSCNFTVVRVHVVRSCAPICRKIVFGYFARGGLDHLPGAARRAAAWLHVLCLRCVIGNRKSGL